MNRPQATWLPDGRRLHLNHGPIDLILSAEGPDRAQAFRNAEDRFDEVLESLVDELDILRRPLTLPRDAADRALTIEGRPTGPIAKRMMRALLPHHTTFVTPMAAVAGAVADEILEAMRQGTRLTKAVVNNGGDIAFHLYPGQVFRATAPAGDIEITSDDPARGIATSGWRGRSHSLGIADAVTVLARNAAEADVAATLIANAVDLPGHPAVTRQQACILAPDSDLGTRLVTTRVAYLSPTDIRNALDRGEKFARNCCNNNTILAASLTLAGETRTLTNTKKALSHA